VRAKKSVEEDKTEMGEYRRRFWLVGVLSLPLLSVDGSMVG
jgi:hypothetical protein